MNHPFDDAIALSALHDGRYAGATSPAYANMVGPFGGVTGATLLNAVLQHPARLGEPSALTDGGFEIEARPVRTNRSTQHWIVELLQNGEVAATATAVCALRRETWSAPEAQAPQDLPPPDSLPRGDLSGRPAWVRRYDMRFAHGGMPEAFDGQEQADS